MPYFTATKLSESLRKGCRGGDVRGEHIAKLVSINTRRMCVKAGDAQLQKCAFSKSKAR